MQTVYTYFDPTCQKTKGGKPSDTLLRLTKRSRRLATKLPRLSTPFNPPWYFSKEVWSSGIARIHCKVAFYKPMSRWFEIPSKFSYHVACISKVFQSRGNIQLSSNALMGLSSVCVVDLTASATSASVMSSKNWTGFGGGLGSSPAVPIIMKLWPYFQLMSTLILIRIVRIFTSFNPNLFKSVSSYSYSSLSISLFPWFLLHLTTIPLECHLWPWSFDAQEVRLFVNRFESWRVQLTHRYLMERLVWMHSHLASLLT